MLSLSGCAAVVVLAAAGAIAWRTAGRKALHDAAPEVPEAEAAPGLPLQPDAAAWCAVLESVAGSAALCVDEALCLVAAGPRGVVLAAGALGCELTAGDGPMLHLVDLAPSDATAAILELAASVRRGERATGELSWNGARARVVAIPLGNRWIALSLRGLSRALVLIAALLVVAGSGSASAAVAEETSPARAELAQQLLREAGQRLRAGRLLQARELAEAIEAVAGAEAATMLQHQIREAAAHSSAAFATAAADAAAAGEARMAAAAIEAAGRAQRGAEEP